MRAARSYPFHILVIALTPLILGGCLAGKRSSDSVHDSNSQTSSFDSFDADGSDSGLNPQTVASVSGTRSGGSVHMQFDVHRVEIPMQEVRESLSIWKHLDESMGDPQLTALLARNGLRIGKGDRDAWPAMRVILERAGGRMGTYRHVVDNGLSLIINLDQTQGGEAYFVHGRGGSLRGGSFPAGTKRLVVDYATQDDDPTIVILRITPDLQEARTRTRWVEQQGNVARVKDHLGIVFDELTVSVKLGAAEFLVMGGSEKADGGYLIGSRWLTSTLRMKQHETVLFIRPKLVRIK